MQKYVCMSLTVPGPILHYTSNKTAHNHTTQYTVSVRKTRQNVLVLLTLAIAEESPTRIRHPYAHPVTRAIEASHVSLQS